MILQVGGDLRHTHPWNLMPGRIPTMTRTSRKFQPKIIPDAPNVWIIYLHYIGEKWPHEQGEMAW